MPFSITEITPLYQRDFQIEMIVAHAQDLGDTFLKLQALKKEILLDKNTVEEAEPTISLPNALTKKNFFYNLRYRRAFKAQEKLIVKEETTFKKEKEKLLGGLEKAEKRTDKILTLLASEQFAYGVADSTLFPSICDKFPDLKATFTTTAFNGRSFQKSVENHFAERCNNLKVDERFRFIVNQYNY